MKVFLYGHYDSRGGTTAIEADTKEEADKRYMEDVFCCDEAYIKEFGPDICSDENGDYLGQFELEDAPTDVPEEGMDLEGDHGWVITNMPQFHEISGTPGIEARKDIRLRYIAEEPTEFDPDAEADEEIPSMPGWYHPRWDDDAYNFILIPKKRKQ